MTDLSNYTDEQLLGMLQQQPNLSQDASNGKDNQGVDVPLRIPSMVGGALLKGFSGVAGLPGDVGAAYDKYLGNPAATAISDLTGLPKPDQNFLSHIGPTTSEVLASTKAAGLTDNPNLAPRTRSEDYISQGAEGVGGALPYALLGGGLIQGAKLVAQGLGSGLGNAAADQLTAGNPIAKFLASVAGGGLANSSANLVEKTANAVQGNISPVIQAYKDAGVTPRMLGDVTQNPTLQKLQTFGNNTSAAKQTLDEFGQSVSNLAGNIGSSHTLQEAGQAVQNESENWLKTFKDNSKTAWTAVDSAIGAETPVHANQTMQTLDLIKSKAGENASAKDFLNSSLATSINNILKDSTVNKFDWVTGARTTGYQPLQWQTMQAVRSRVGEYLSNPQSIADAGHAQAKMLYGALTSDMKNVAAQNPGASQLFDEANVVTSNGHQFIDNVLSKIDNKDASKAASNLLISGTSGGETLQALRQNMPKAADELAAVSLRRHMAGQSEGSAGNAVSPSRWLASQDPTRRLSPEAYEALYPEPQVQRKLSALDTVADNMRNTEEFANHPNTASHAAMYAAVPTAVEGFLQGHELGGVPGGIAGMIMGGAAPFALSPAAGAFTNNPAFAKFLAAKSTGQPLGLLPSLQMGLSPKDAPFSLFPGVQK